VCVCACARLYVSWFRRVPSLAEQATSNKQLLLPLGRTISGGQTLGRAKIEKRRQNAETPSLKQASLCVFITAVPITKLFAWGGGGNNGGQGLGFCGVTVATPVSESRSRPQSQNSNLRFKNVVRRRDRANGLLNFDYLLIIIRKEMLSA
jgi:hypothetical protein